MDPRKCHQFSSSDEEDHDVINRQGDIRKDKLEKEKNTVSVLDLCGLT
jgi:hypothetical protein